jgi:hypothetical protein
VQFFYDALWARGPGTAKRTRWHQDQPYYPIDAEQVAIMWLPVDPVTTATCLECIRGSHRWGRWFQPELSRDGAMLFGAGECSYEKMPDIDSHRDDYDIVSFDMSPGDCIVFAGLTVHGAPGNSSDRRQRRALSTVWMGDDAVFGARPGKVRPCFEGHGLNPGDPMDCDYFPRVWPRNSEASSWTARFGAASRFHASIRANKESLIDGTPLRASGRRDGRRLATADRRPACLYRPHPCRLAPLARRAGGNRRLRGRRRVALPSLRHGAMVGVIAPATWPDPDQGTSAPMRY